MKTSESSGENWGRGVVLEDERVIKRGPQRVKGQSGLDGQRVLLRSSILLSASRVSRIYANSNAYMHIQSHLRRASENYLNGSQLTFITADPSRNSDFILIPKYLPITLHISMSMRDDTKRASEMK